MQIFLHGLLPQAYNQDRFRRRPRVQAEVFPRTYECASVRDSHRCERVLTTLTMDEFDRERVARELACVGDFGPALHRTEGEYWRWCPRCGHELHNEKCKLRCQRCHYFLSCSDFD